MLEGADSTWIQENEGDKLNVAVWLVLCDQTDPFPHCIVISIKYKTFDL